MKNNQIENRLITASETASILGITPKTLWEWTNNGIIPAVKIPGTRTKYDIEDIYGLIEQHKNRNLPAPVEV